MFELRLLEDLDLADVDILEGVEVSTLAFNVLFDRSGNEFLDDSLQVTARDFTGNVLSHTTTDSSNLGGLGVGGLSDLVSITLGESDAEDTEKISVTGTDSQGVFDRSVPLANNGTELVTSKAHSVEVGKTFASLDIFANETELLEVSVDVVEISERNFVDTSLKVVTSNAWKSRVFIVRSSWGLTCSLSTVDQGFSDLAVGEHRRGLDVVPLFTSEGVNDLLLVTFLDHLLTLADSHG